MSLRISIKLLFCIFTISLVLLGPASSKHNQYSTLIWEMGTIDTPNSISNLDGNSFIATTQKGLLANISKVDQTILSSKNHYSDLNKKTLVFSTDSYIVHANLSEGYADLLRSDSLELLHSFTYDSDLAEESNKQKESTFLKCEFLKVKTNAFLGVLISEASLVFFNDKEVLDEFYVEKKERVLDYILESNLNNKEAKIKDSTTASLLIVKEGKLFVKEILISHKSTNNYFSINSVKDYSEVSYLRITSDKDQFYLTKDFIIKADATPHFIYHLRSNSSSETTETESNIIKSSKNNTNFWEIEKRLNKIIAVGETTISIHSLKADSNSKNKHQTEKIDIKFNSQDNRVINTVITWTDNKKLASSKVCYIGIQSKNINNFAELNVYALEFEQEKDHQVIYNQSFQLSKNCEMKSFNVSAENDFMVVCEYGEIRLYNMKENKLTWSMNDNFSDIAFSKLLNIPNLKSPGNEDEEARMTSLESLFNNGNELPPLLVNIAMNVKDSVMYFVDSIISGVSTLTSKYKDTMKEKKLIKKNTSLKTLLILQKRNSLFIYDLYEDLVLAKHDIENYQTVSHAYFTEEHFYKTDDLESPFIFIELQNSLDNSVKNFIVISAKTFKHATYSLPNHEVEFLSKLNLLTDSSFDGVSESIDYSVISSLPFFKENEYNRSENQHGRHRVKSKNTKTKGQADAAKNFKHVQVREDTGFIHGININIIDSNSDNRRPTKGDSELKSSMSVAWTLKTKKILKYVFPQFNANSSSCHASQGKIYHKYVNTNLMLLITQNIGDSVLIEIIDTLNGKILKKINLEKVSSSHDILAVFNENQIFVAYTKKEKNSYKQELLSIEMMMREIDEQFSSFVNKLFAHALYEENPLTKIPLKKAQDPIFLTHTYVFAKKIKALFSSRSLISVSNKAVLIVFENNLISIVDNRNLSARRPIVKDPQPGQSGTPAIDPANSVYVDNELPGYSPVVAVDYKIIISDAFLKDRVDKVQVIPSSFESTFTLCTYGIGIKCYKVYPDKTFDSLADNFNYSLIGLFMIGLFAVVFTLRKNVKEMEFKKSFLKE